MQTLSLGGDGGCVCVCLRTHACVFSAWWARYWNHTLPSPEQLSPSSSEGRGGDEGCLGSRYLNVFFIRTFTILRPKGF